MTACQDAIGWPQINPVLPLVNNNLICLPIGRYNFCAGFLLADLFCHVATGQAPHNLEIAKFSQISRRVRTYCFVLWDFSMFWRIVIFREVIPLILSNLVCCPLCLGHWGLNHGDCLKSLKGEIDPDEVGCQNSASGSLSAIYLAENIRSIIGGI